VRPSRSCHGGSHDRGRPGETCWPGRPRLWVKLMIEVDADPMVELTAARLLLITLDELRAEDLAIHDASVQLEGWIPSGGPAEYRRRPPGGEGQPGANP
jgi:hypothetical protein